MFLLETPNQCLQFYGNAMVCITLENSNVKYLCFSGVKFNQIMIFATSIY